MNEKQYANLILDTMLKAKDELINQNDQSITLSRSIDTLNEFNLSFNKLQEEVEKLGFHVNYSKNIKSNWWKKQPNTLIFYFNETDL